MICWVCGTEVTEKNSSGRKKLGKIKNECVACHSVYNLFSKLVKEEPSELELRLIKTQNLITMYNMVLSEDVPTAKELTKKFVRGK